MGKLTVGEKAPLFTGVLQNGTTITLESLKGKKVVLYFYPKDDTPGCTAEACDLRDHYAQFLDKGYVIFGISSDSEKSHQKFKDKYSLPFDLIADTDKTIHELYGTWVEKSMYGKTYMGTARHTFVIDENGIIEKIIEKVDTKNHTAQII